MRADLGTAWPSFMHSCAMACLPATNGCESFVGRLGDYGSLPPLSESDEVAAGLAQVLIRHGGKQVHLGYFTTAEEAHARYLEAKRILHKGCTI